MQRSDDAPLRDLRAVCLALNLPGPLAAARLAALGAAVAKVEPPDGDPFETYCPSWYRVLCRAMTVVRLNLRDPDARRTFEHMLAEADVLLTAVRPAALARLGLDWPAVHARHPRLCTVRVIGFPPPLENFSGHDLTYQATAGLVAAPAAPTTLTADLAGAERSVTAALSLLLRRATTGQSGWAEVSLSECAVEFAEPLAHGLTGPGSLLGGGAPWYGVYPSRDGWIAVAALEPPVIARLEAELHYETSASAEIEGIFRQRTAADWERWALDRDLPLVAVRSPAVPAAAGSQNVITASTTGVT